MDKISWHPSNHERGLHVPNRQAGSTGCPASLNRMDRMRVWPQYQDLGEEVGHGELGRGQKIGDGPRSHLGVMLGALSGKHASNKGPIW